MHAQHVPIEHTHKLSTQVTARRERVFFRSNNFFDFVEKKYFQCRHNIEVIFVSRPNWYFISNNPVDRGMGPSSLLTTTFHNTPLPLSFQK